MITLAIALYVVYLLVAFVVRTVIQVRRTGDSGWRGLSGRPGSAEWFAGAACANYEATVGRFVPGLGRTAADEATVGERF